MPQVTSKISTSGANWSPSAILNRYGSNYSKLSHENPAFKLGRMNTIGSLAFQKDKMQKRIQTRFQLGDFVEGKEFGTDKIITGKILSIENKEDLLDTVYIMHKGQRLRIDVATMEKLAESTSFSILSFQEFILLS